MVCKRIERHRKESSYDSMVAKIEIPTYSLSDEDYSSYQQLSVESDVEDTRDVKGSPCADSRPSPFLCRECGLVLDSSSRYLDLAFNQHCLKCLTGIPLLRDSEVADSSGCLNSDRMVFSCRLCSFATHYSSHLKRHMKIHNGEKPFKCMQCSYASAQLVNLKRHARTHTGEKPFCCERCSFSCSSLGNLKRHMRIHTREKPYKCDMCEYCCNQSRNLKRHMLGHRKKQAQRPRHKREKKKDGGAEEGSAEADSCRDDGEDSLMTDLSLHVNGCDEFIPSCNRLHSEVETISLLEARGCAEEVDTLPELLFPFTCRLCGLVLDDGFAHEEGLTDQICDHCSLAVLSTDGASSPHSGFMCSLCSFVTHYPNHLARHMKTHSGEKPYKCVLCDYASAHFDNLKRHQRVHTGEKPYKCDLCDYACGNLANLKRHGRIHSGDKPFQCNLCNYTCNQSMNLKRHMLRHTGEKPFCCSDCRYTTGHWDNYKRHQKIHGLCAEGWINPYSVKAGPATLSKTDSFP
ncbi:zinc finger protein 513 isoform X2 [Ambystoma mexicanum]|uniref:zinc finger protein 513 isoform X2 n=1 Tax=Ambystoma mexicanum TaxID=8296 RepID=UPI0037E883FB